MEKEKYALIAEGSSETAILDILLDNEKLLFTRKTLFANGGCLMIDSVVLI